MKPIISAQQILEAEQQIKTLLALMPTFIEEYAVRAKVKREKFDALKREGFTDEQAMQVIVAAGSDLQL